MSLDKFREEWAGDEARARAGDLIAMIDALGADVGVEDIQRAALIELTPAATQAVFNLGCLTLTNMDCMAAILSGCCSEERISRLRYRGRAGVACVKLDRLARSVHRPYHRGRPIEGRDSRARRGDGDG